jgi:hypothetical protein
MLRRIGIALLWALGGYLMGALGGGLLVSWLSSNQFDRGMEATMTGAFVTGPLVAVVGLLVGVWRGGRSEARAGG